MVRILSVTLAFMLLSIDTHWSKTWKYKFLVNCYIVMEPFSRHDFEDGSCINASLHIEG